MKTYYIFLGLFACIILSCSKSDSTDPGGGNSVEVSDYAVLLRNGNNINTQLLNGSSDKLELNTAQSLFVETTLPDLSYLKETNFLQFHKTEPCSGVITQHNFDSDSSQELTVFEDLNACDLEVTAIIESEKTLSIGYVLNTASPATYWVRIIDLNTPDSFVDLELDKKPLDFATSSNRLYVLTIDEQITDENSLSVIDVSSKTSIDELGLGYDARRIFMNASDDLIIGYDELHGVVDNVSLDISYQQYNNEFTPKFAFSNSRNFGKQGRLYYSSDPASNSTYPLVASSYDFENNLETIYVYEALLTEKQLTDYQIKTTTSVSFDTKNNMVLVGYEKTDGVKGGLLRYQLDTANEVIQIDQLDLEGIPYEIIVR